MSAAAHKIILTILSCLLLAAVLILAGNEILDYFSLPVVYHSVEMNACMRVESIGNNMTCADILHDTKYITEYMQ